MTNRWENNGNSERLFISLGSKITVDSDYCHEIKRCLLLGRKALTNLDSILKGRDSTLPIKAYIVKTMVFPVVIYGCESWTIKKAERWRIDAFELGVGEVSWESRELQDQILKEINLEYSFEGLMLNLKLQYFGHLIWRAESWEKPLMLGKTEGRRRQGTTEDEIVGWYHWLNGHEFEQALGDSEGQGSLACCSSWGHKELDTTEWLNNI